MSICNSGRRSGASTALVAAVVAGLCLAAVGAVFVLFPNTPTPIGDGGSPASASQTSAEGLMFSATQNATTIHQGEAIGVSVALMNTMNHTMVLHPDYASYSNVTGWDDYSIDTCGSIFPAYIAVFSGHFTSDNFSSAGTPLQVADPAPIPCALSTPIKEIDLFPNSSTAAITMDVTVTASLTFALAPFQCPSANSCSNLEGASGYWSGGAMHPFPVGSYTVAAADLWGQTLMLYFEVV